MMFASSLRPPTSTAAAAAPADPVSYEEERADELFLAALLPEIRHEFLEEGAARAPRLLGSSSVQSQPAACQEVGGPIHLDVTTEGDESLCQWMPGPPSANPRSL